MSGSKRAGEDVLMSDRGAATTSDESTLSAADVLKYPTIYDVARVAGVAPATMSSKPMHELVVTNHRRAFML